MRGRKPRDLALGAEDAAALRQVARCQSLPWFQVRRARTVLAVAGGERVDAVAGRMGCDGMRPRHGLADLPPLRGGWR